MVDVGEDRQEGRWGKRFSREKIEKELRGRHGDERRGRDGDERGGRNGDERRCEEM